jgi:hypothetical protein
MVVVSQMFPSYMAPYRDQLVGLVGTQRERTRHHERGTVLWGEDGWRASVGSLDQLLGQERRRVSDRLRWCNSTVDRHDQAIAPGERERRPCILGVVEFESFR